MQRVRCVLCDLEQPVLDAGKAVLQAEVEDRPLGHCEVPHRFSLRNAEAEPKRQPGLTDFRGARQNMQPLRQQTVHHEPGGRQRR